jgi:hypothetical protein
MRVFEATCAQVGGLSAKYALPGRRLSDLSDVRNSEPPDAMEGAATSDTSDIEAQSALARRTKHLKDTPHQREPRPSAFITRNSVAISRRLAIASAV